MAGAAAVTASRSMAAAGSIDPNLSVFLSDVHVPGDGVKLHWLEIDPAWMLGRLSSTVDEILAMRPRPANVVVFGDIAYLRGELSDYRKTEPLFRKLAEAGVRVTFGMGNHDRRGPFLEVYPQYRAASRVPGEIVSVVSLGAADLILLDTLHENLAEPQKENPGSGRLSPAQVNWMRTELSRWPRPFFLGAHHRFDDVAMPKGALKDLLFSLKKCCGYVHGHLHEWNPGMVCSWGDAHRTMRTLGLPSVGFFGDIGYVTFRTGPTEAVATLVQRDYYFPRYQPDPARRDPEWRQVVMDQNGQTCTFSLK